MGAAPSRETHRRGLFTVNQGPSSSTSSASAKRQDIVLVPLTREYFPSPDCPLFVQFHKARCDAAVNYYFRRPGDPGDLSTIPTYAGSTKTMPEERMRRQRLRREVAAQRRKRAAEAKGDEKGEGGGLEEIIDPDLERQRKGADENDNEGGAGASDVEEEEEGSGSGEEDDSYPSREALYRGVVDHVEEVLFDTDEEMREAYAYACGHPGATTGPNGQKLHKVLPILCAVAFRMDASKVNPTLSSSGNPKNAPGEGTDASAAAPSPAAAPNQQLMLDTGVLLNGNILNIVGCFGFVSMQEEVDAILQLQQERQGGGGGTAGLVSSPTSPTAAGSFGNGGYRSPGGVGGGGSYRHDPYAFGGSLTSNHGGSEGLDGITPVAAAVAARSGSGNLSADIVTLPPPVAAPLAALVFLTKSAGEQNLGRVTHIAATTYYYQLIQAGVIQRRGAAAGGGGELPPSSHHHHHQWQQQQPQGSAMPYTRSGVSPKLGPGSPDSSYGGGGSNHSSRHVRGSYNPATYPPTSPLTSMPELFHPPMETFSFSSLLTNIPILSFLYEMKCRWGYLGVLKGGTPTANNSFASGSMHSFPSFSLPGGRRQGTMMGNHSTGGLAAVDLYSGQDVTDEMEMWITPDEMIHGRISRDLASRLCLSLAERPEVMQERVLQLPSEEEGYWSYRGLVGLSKPPPVPGPGRIVSISPTDVYVVGSDVLPGFDEGDILRFDPDRMVWFADHSIPLEGVVLAAMRPYCKAAREADPTDPHWVTRLASLEELDYLKEVKGEEVFPTPPATPEQRQAMSADANLRVVHEHEGIFYVYRFERDGATYYHGTIPNFANPNKRRNTGAAAAATVAATTPSHPHPVAAESAAGGGGGESYAKPAAAAATSGGGGAGDKPTVQVPKTIASALFTLFPGGRRTQEAEGSGAVVGAASTTPAAAAAENAASNRQQSPAQVPSPSLRDPPPAASATTTGAAGVSEESDIPAYLRGRVTSTAIDAARKLVMNLYSYAYGAPARNTSTRVAAAGVPLSPSGSRGVRTPHSTTVSAATAGTAGGGQQQQQRTSYPPTSPLHNNNTNNSGTAPGSPAASVGPPTVAALNASGYRGTAGQSPHTANVATSSGHGGGGMYPRNYRPLSSAARSSTNSTPAVRNINPNAVILPGHSPTHGAVYQQVSSMQHQPRWQPQNQMVASPEVSTAGPTFGSPPSFTSVGMVVGPGVTGASQTRSHPSHVPNVHIRVGSRSSSHHPAEEVGRLNLGSSSTPNCVSPSIDLAGSPSHADPSTDGSVSQPQVKRYKEGGNYVWDWRVSTTVAAAQEPSQQHQQ